MAFLRDILFSGDDALANGSAPPDVYDRMCALAATAPPGCNGLVYTPWIYGERCPVEDRSVRAGFHNLSLGHTRADLIRAVLEGIALNTRWMLGPFEKNLGRTTATIHVAGGGAHSDVWCQIFADVLGRPMRQVAEPIQVNVRGAAFIGAAGLGMLNFEEIEDIVEMRGAFEPLENNRAVYDLLFREFRALYRKNHRLHARLNAFFSGEKARKDE